MNRIIFTLSLLLVCSTIMAQEAKPVEVPNYKLYPTANMWTFLKLDTRNGVVHQIQYSVDSADKRFETWCNPIPCVTKSEERPGRFELYPTENNYNFLLLDRISGKVYQLQWSLKPENRGAIPIE